MTKKSRPDADEIKSRHDEIKVVRITLVLLHLPSSFLRNVFAEREMLGWDSWCWIEIGNYRQIMGNIECNLIHLLILNDFEGSNIGNYIHKDKIMQ